MNLGSTLISVMLGTQQNVTFLNLHANSQKGSPQSLI